MKIFKAILASAVISLSCHGAVAASPPGQVIGWGFNVFGQAQIADPNVGWTGAVAIAGQIVTNVVVISVGMDRGLLLRSDGTVVGTGFNHYGEATGVGVGSDRPTNGVVTIGGRVLSNVIGIDSADYFSVALHRDGTVSTWGFYGPNETHLPSGLSNVVAVAAGAHHALALKSDGTVSAWGAPRNSFAGLSNIVAISATKNLYGHDLALKSDATVIDWKCTEDSATVPEGLSNVVSIAAGYGHSLALKGDGTVAEWDSSNPTPTNVAGLSNIVAIAAGNEYSLALKKDGTVVAWGNRRFYKDVPADLTNVIAIAAGEGFCLAIKKP
jgi:alpha-tubulin suppressor-like RCC1 family protein